MTKIEKTKIDLDNLDDLELPVEIPDRPDTVHMNHWSVPVRVLYAVLQAMGPHALALSTPEQITGHFSRALIAVDRATDPAGRELEEFIGHAMTSLLTKQLQGLMNPGGPAPRFTHGDVARTEVRMRGQLADQLAHSLIGIIDYYAAEFDTEFEPLRHPSRR